MRGKAFILACVSALCLAAPADAAIVYMTGNNNPWFIAAGDPGSPETAMNGAFGAGNWTKQQGFTTSVFNPSNSFVYVEGGDAVGIDAFINGGGRAAIESFVNAGGSVFVNAARNDSYAALNVAFGATLTGASFCAAGCALTPAGIAAGLGANGAGTIWGGNYFSHDVVGLANALISYTGGTILADGRFGAGYLMVGGQTAPFFHNPDEAAYQLRINELTYAAAQANGAIPEPATWALMIVGFGAVGAAMRTRRRSAVAAAG